VLKKVREICACYFNPDELLPAAKKALEESRRALNHVKETAALKSKIESLTAHLDKMYMDKLAGILDDKDFARIYQRVKEERAALEQKLSELHAPDCSPEEQEAQAEELVQRFIDNAFAGRELLVSLIERVELTEEKQIFIRFRFRPLEGMGKSL
jgi:hypothetical protein